MTAAIIDADLGEVRKVGAHYEISFERRLAQPVARVWAALTEPARIVHWLAEAKVDLRVGGRFELYWPAHAYRMSGVIVELAPLAVIAWTWPADQHPDSVVRWELFPDGEGTRLLLTQTGLTAPPLKDVAAGWHTHLEGLAGAADGIATPWRAEREREISKLYADLTSA
jgi:uncharacterized protein YndB with AHSA1/START domain